MAGLTSTTTLVILKGLGEFSLITVVTIIIFSLHQLNVGLCQDVLFSKPRQKKMV